MEASDQKPASARFEQFRQALSIHGGFSNLCVAALGVKLSRLRIPSRRLRGKIYRTVFGAKYPPIDERELERPLEEFVSFNDLFTRGVRKEFRPLPADPDCFICPCDGTVQDAGCIGADTVMTVKGIDYRLDSLIPEAPVDSFLGGRFAVFFLSPSDCHRVYAPQTGTLEDVTHVPGYRLLVHPPYQRREFPVFTLNERVILRMTTPFGACIVVMVAGWGVGHVTLPFDAEFRPRAPRITRRNYVDGHPMERGDWLATFELGSTAILLLERADRTAPLVNPGDVVRFGQPAFGVVGTSS